ncbi:hypothetical protein [Legionella sp. PC997]|uniref:hypothetical protein n=1 Tax=Legionella sp. PC997 TaxID=2755562 RepID=UPI0015F7A865|nr:hypothetical protein [Legionella sp. PC997]QMT58785.1 hypothetical protein HBNCFIEN_00138 [Legionella sp. PC997]
MATSSAILQSFLRDALKDKKKLADLSYGDLLDYNRAECGLIQIDSLPGKFSEIEELSESTHAIILHGNRLYYGDKKSNSIYPLARLKKPVKPIIPSTLGFLKRNSPEYIEYIKSSEYLQYLQKLEEYNNKLITYNEESVQYNKLKKACTPSYKRARGEELECIKKFTGRAFTEYRSNAFLSSLNFYLELLNKTDSVMFKYMNDLQKEERVYELQMTLLLLLAQQKHEIEYKKFENIREYNTQIKKCSDFLRLLDPVYQARIKEFEIQQAGSDAKPVKYMGISVGQLLAEDIVDLSIGTTKSIKKHMGKLNEKRLYWVWGSTFLKTVIGLVPEGRYYAEQAAEAIKTPDFYTGNLSWTLYYARFFLELGILLKHTIKGPWMDEVEANTPWQDRFLTQWSQRKFDLLNDSVWGTANLLCFFWLTGKGSLGMAGDAVTLALLVFDIIMTVWAFEEERIKHNKAMMQYNDDIERLEQQLQTFRDMEKERQLTNEQQKDSRQIEIQLRTLKNEKSKCERDWQLQKISLINNIAYAVGLMLAFLILTMPFMPIAAPVLASMAIAGAVLCFVFTVINNATKGGIELYKTHLTIQEQMKQASDLTEQLKKQYDHLDKKEKQFIFLEIKQCLAETEYQKRVRVYQSASLVRSIIIEAFIPAVVFASLMFVPLGIGVPVLLIAVALGIASHYAVETLFKPKEKEALEFNSTEYEEFCEDIFKVDFKLDKSPAFFKKGSENNSIELCNMACFSND